MSDQRTKTYGVEFYSGGHRDEKPHFIRVAGACIPVLRVIREERIGSSYPEAGYYRIFLVETQDGSLWKLREAPETAEGWHVEKFCTNKRSKEVSCEN